MKLVLFIIPAVLVLLILAFLISMGLFKKIHISEVQSPELYIVYLNIEGDYRKSAAVMDEIYYDLKDNHGIETTNGFGFYFDNPKEVETDNLRSIAGCVVSKEDYDKIKNVKYLKNIIENQSAFTTEFPFKNGFSVLFSLIKVYPAINNYLKVKHIEQKPVIEIYNIPEKKIQYYILSNILKEDLIEKYYLKQ